MTAMFPDSGVPAADAKNSSNPDTNPNCEELWYSTSRCQPRFDPAAANAVLSELLALINMGTVVYDCTRLDNLQLAVRQLIQHGLPLGAELTGGPFNYVTAMLPTLTHYNNFFTPVIVPNIDNQGAVAINFNGLGLVPVLRNDGEQLQAKDLRANRPTLISYWGGAFYLVGLAASQVPIIVRGGIIVWIRTDGNDTTGDGSANTPDKAFRTIAGCWNAVGSRFAATPSFSINMRLGIPGDYEGAAISSFGGAVTLTGDPANPAVYRILTAEILTSAFVCLWIGGINTFVFNGVSLIINHAPGVGLRVANSAVSGQNSRIEVTIGHAITTMMDLIDGGKFSTLTGSFVFNGNGLTVGNIVNANRHASLVGSFHGAGEPASMLFQNIVLSDVAFGASGLSTMEWGGFTSWTVTAVTGLKYFVGENSIINMFGQVVPGTLAGSFGSGGQFIP